MADHPVLKPKPTLDDLQQYVAAIVEHRGFANDSVQYDFIMLTEEVGELAKALRKWSGDSMATDSTVSEMEHEAADVLMMLLGFCNQAGIDLEKALRDKEEKNKLRTWK